MGHFWKGPNRFLSNKICLIYGFSWMFRLYGLSLEDKTVDHISGTQCTVNICRRVALVCKPCLDQTNWVLYLILWLVDTVTYCFLWLFSRFPFPNALFYTDAISDTVTLPYWILWLLFIQIWGKSAIFFAIFYLFADIFSF